MIMGMRRPLAAVSARQKRAKRGFTLTEIAIVLGIVGLILGAIWVAASAVYSNLRVSKATTQLLAITQNVRAMYATSNAVDTTATMSVSGVQAAAGLTYIDAGVFPTDALVASAAGGPNNETANPWNGGIAIVPTTVNTAGDSFAVEFDKVPQSACISLLVSNTGNGRDTGLYEATAGAGGALKIGSGSTLAATTFPLSLTAATTACAGTTATGNNVAFGFQLKG